MAKSKNINLNLTPENEIEETLFDDWRQSIDGYNGENAVNPSNFEIVDKEIGDIKEALKHVSTLKFEVVQELPEVGQTNIIYLVPSKESKEHNFYDEYMYREELGNFELIGSTQITFDNVPTEDSPNAITSGGVYTALQGKVDKEQGKGLSSNDYTNNEKSKLEGIETGAQVNVQADWEEQDPSSDAYIANKPTVPAAQVNSDWNAESGVAQILNKPDLSIYAENEDLANVAFSGSYNDLLDTPDIPQSQIQSDWEQEDTTAKDYIKNKPTIIDPQIAPEFELFKRYVSYLASLHNIELGENTVVEYDDGTKEPIQISYIDYGKAVAETDSGIEQIIVEDGSSSSEAMTESEVNDSFVIEV